MSSAKEFSVPFWALLATYSIWPLCLAIAAYDQIWGGGYLRSVLPQRPEGVFIYMLIFVIPHIIGSFLSFADKDYMAFYSRRMQLDLPVLTIISLLIFYASPVLASAVYAVYTEYHAFSQQAGLGRFYFKTNLPEFQYWRWGGVIIGVLGYSLVYRGLLYPSVMNYATAVGSILAAFALFSVLTFLMLLRIHNPQGKRYLLTVWASLLGVLYLFSVGYPVLAIFSARVVHDVSAFMAYTTHDYNRRLHVPNNLVYRSLAFLNIPVYVLTPLLAIFIAYFLVRIPYIAGSAVFLVSMLHYYVEGFIWKNGSIHRQYLKFA